MESNRKVKVKSMVEGGGILNFPDLKFRREFSKKEAVVSIPFGIMEEGLYDVGFRKMIDQGVLLIENQQDRIDLGLEEQLEEGEIAPLSFATPLTNGQIVKLLKLDTVEKFEEIFRTSSKVQRDEIIACAVKEKITDMPRAEIIKKYAGTDLLTAVQLKIRNEEE